ncbi:MAG: hypothetical protein MJA29_04425 [Candidatus Omnitrophica bacterium]|nr:hypothetical protein [Candidatus Omnitrophota bacterium]
MVNVLFSHGRSAMEVSWPSHRGKYGTCDFMTKTCAEECRVSKSLPEIRSYSFFVKNDAKTIINRMLQEIEDNKATNLVWWCESGDCPASMTEKISNIMHCISDAGIPQSGFTRNKALWSRANNIKNCNIALTVENEQEAVRLSEHGLISLPNYKTWKVKIFVEGQLYLCGGGGVGVPSCGMGGVEQDDYWGEEDCSICFKNGKGCYSKAA